MKGLVKTWIDVIFNPGEGFKSVDKNTGVFTPIVILVLIAIIAISLVIPVITSPDYLHKSMEIQLAKMGKNLSSAELEAAKASVDRPITKIVAITGAYIGSIVTYLLVFYGGALALFILVKIFGVKDVSYRLLLRIIVLASVIIVFQSLIAGLILIFSDWKNAVLSAGTVTELKEAIQVHFSISTFLDSKTIGTIPFYIIDYFTNIFNIIYFILLFLGLYSAAKVEYRKSLVITILYAIIFALPGFVPLLLVK